MFLESYRGAAAGGERGSALLAVIGVMAVIAVISVTIVASTMTTLGTTTSSRAGAQAQAAAEAGIDATVARMATSSCPPLTSPDPGVTFDVVLTFQLADAATWLTGCPSAQATRLRITSTGFAASAAVGGNRSGDSRTVQATYLARVVVPELSPDVAVHSDASIGFGGSSQVFFPAAGERPKLYVKDGNVECTGSSIMRANVYVPHGAFTTSESCQFFGDVLSADTARLGGSSIVHGNVTAPSIDMKGSSILKKDAWALGAITMNDSSQINGNVIAESIDMKGSSLITGSKTLSPASSRSFPLFPPAPAWFDFSYERNNWSKYITVVVSGTCTFAQLQPIVNLLAVSPGLLDARGCTTGITSIGDEILTLKNDLVIITNSVDLRGSAQFQAVTAGTKLSLIMPDEVADGEPTCAATARANIQNSFIAGTNVQALFYSPCAVSFTGSAIWYGQMYGASVAFGGSAILNHIPMTSPTTSTTASGSVKQGSFTVGTRESIRDMD